nr:transposase [Streptomyces sp. NBC_00974]
MEDQIGAFGLVLNTLVLFNTRSMHAAITQLRADGFDVRDEDVARLSPFVRHHINMLDRYSFQLPDLPGGCGPCVTPMSSMRNGGRQIVILVAAALAGCPYPDSGPTVPLTGRAVVRR